MAHGVCPWWAGYFLLSPLRRLAEDPRAVLAPVVRLGMTVVEPGCGMGYFTVELARLVGPEGRVVATDLQPRMLRVAERRLARAGLLQRVELRRVSAGSLGLDDLVGSADLALALHMVHEVPSAEAFFAEIGAVLGVGGKVVLIEPAGHVSVEEFAAELLAARGAGFDVEGSDPGPRARRALLVLRDRRPAAES